MTSWLFFLYEVHAEAEEKVDRLNATIIRVKRSGHLLKYRETCRYSKKAKAPEGHIFWLVRHIKAGDSTDHCVRKVNGTVAS
jgi:hypothetical protein